ncbi:hypothetical protein Pint_36658 [Pistacia integerrima]|uniref:Uncharacterized protein n=3 Tax=Pistacia TaxID=55512 RepID=A0ACC1ALP8_9ROSI|nr:hypothetical protein Pint_36672 [Pistacia integerrima]KAJ0028261.1 hypothetical protein Pint_36658 [Pistacia integerrima]KAJ0087601.1 hypothetical protein Patl1_33190 [Pistacia atlantica]
MGKLGFGFYLILLVNLCSLLSSFACPGCRKPSPAPKCPAPYPPHVKPPFHPKPPHVKPPYHPKPPYVPKPPVVTPPPYVPKPPPGETPPPSPPKQATCPIDTLKLGACVDVLGGLVKIGVGSSAKDSCCPVLQGLVDLDAAVCLCTTIKAKLLNINIILPIALKVLVDCGKNPPSGFQCPT